MPRSKSKRDSLSPERSLDLSIESLEKREMLSASPLTPFDGDAVLYQVHSSGGSGQLSEINVADGTFTDLGPNAGFSINGVGFRTEDNLIYGMEMSNDNLIRLGSDGQYERLGAIEGLPNGSYYVGDFGHDGLLYVRHADTFYGVNVDSVAVERVVTTSSSVSGIADVAYNADTELYYSVRRQAGTSATADFISIDLRDGENLGQVTVINSEMAPGGTFGAVFADANGRVFASNNSGGLYEIDVASGEATFVGKTPAARSNDGAAPANAAFNLPPVAFDSFISVMQNTTDNSLKLDTPFDPEGDAITITITGLPNLGTVRLGATPVTNGQSLSAEDLTSLVFDAPEVYDGTTDPGDFRYTVSDGKSLVAGSVDIALSGESRIVGQVSVLDQSDFGVYEGYAFNNEIFLTGYDANGYSVQLTTNTDIDGNFTFEGVLPGTYQLQQTQSDGINDGYSETGDRGRSVSSNVIGDIVIPTGSAGEFRGFQFVDYAPSSLSGFVFVDANMDNAIDVTEEGVAGAILRLTGTDDVGNAVTATTTTDSFGYYEFENLRPGNYTISKTQTDGYVNFGSLVGSESGQSIENGVANIDLAAGTEGQGYSFGEIQAGSITGFVYLDLDIDRAFDDGDTGLEGIRVQLSGTDFLGNEVTRTTTTDSGGGYAFENLMPGTWAVKQLDQPENLIDGRENVGTFRGRGRNIARNGRALSDEIVNIQLQQGEWSENNNFSERLNLELANRFDQTIVIEATEGDDTIDISFGDEYHVININGEEQLIAANQTVDIQLNALGGNDTITMSGTESVEELRMWSDQTRFHNEHWRIDVYAGETVTVDGNGGYDLAYLYGTEANEKVKSTESYLRMEGDGFMNKAVGFHRAKAYGNGGDDDRAYFYDSARDDTIKLTDENARMFNGRFYNVAIDFDRVYAYSENGGTDHARFWDSSKSNDIFEATPERARMWNDGFYNAAYGFEKVVSSAINGGNNDRAYLYDSAGDDILVSSPLESGISGADFEYTIDRFERVYAFASEGNDRAFLYDSKLNDRLIAESDNVRLYNSKYYLKAFSFEQVDAYSSNGGSDRAYFHDSAGDDTFIGLENEARMFGDGFNNISHGFKRAYVFADNGGNDTAMLFDSENADTVKSTSSNTRMYGPGYYTRVSSQFEQIEVSFTDASQKDRALVFGVVDEVTLEAAGVFASVMTDFGGSYIYDLDGLKSLNESDASDDDGSDFASLFDEDDLFAIPTV